jgi:hypothetical protein
MQRHGLSPAHGPHAREEEERKDITDFARDNPELAQEKGGVDLVHGGKIGTEVLLGWAGEVLPGERETA